MLAHGLVTPQLGQADLDFMDQQASTLKVDAWKGYTGAAPKGFDRGWFVDDEKIAYPMLERARKLGVKRVCLHKGLPLGPVADYNHPRDLIKAAKDFPDIDFLAYHAGLLTVPSSTGADVPWTSEFCRMKKAEPGIKNIYMELGSTFGQLVTTNPRACAHVLGQLIDAFGADHVLWGTTPSGTGRPSGRSTSSAASRSRRGAREGEVRAAEPDREGADLRVECRAALRDRCERPAQRAAQGRGDADEDGLPRRGAGAQPPLLRLGDSMKFGLRYCNLGRYTDGRAAVELAQAAEASGLRVTVDGRARRGANGYRSRYPYSETGRMGSGLEDFPIPDPLMWLAFVASATRTISSARRS
jgi:hypothetical protein